MPSGVFLKHDAAPLFLQLFCPLSLRNFATSSLLSLYECINTAIPTLPLLVRSDRCCATSPSHIFSYHMPAFWLLCKHRRGAAVLTLSYPLATPPFPIPLYPVVFLLANQRVGHSAADELLSHHSYPLPVFCSPSAFCALHKRSPLQCFYSLDRKHGQATPLRSACRPTYFEDRV